MRVHLMLPLRSMPTQRLIPQLTLDVITAYASHAMAQNSRTPFRTVCPVAMGLRPFGAELIPTIRILQQIGRHSMTDLKIGICLSPYCWYRASHQHGRMAQNQYQVISSNPSMINECLAKWRIAICTIAFLPALHNERSR